jgi:hypothetical protein
MAMAVAVLIENKPASVSEQFDPQAIHRDGHLHTLFMSLKFGMVLSACSIFAQLTYRPSAM